jgi:hypothetical protein
MLVVRNRRVDEGIGQKNEPESHHRNSKPVSRTLKSLLVVWCDIALSAQYRHPLVA